MQHAPALHPDPTLLPRYVALAVGMVLLAAMHGPPVDGEGAVGSPGGCDSDRALHAGCLGAGGAGVVGARAAKGCGSSADNVAGMGRYADDLGRGGHLDDLGGAGRFDELGGGAHLDGPVHLTGSLEHAGRAGSAEAVADAHWQDVAGVVGRVQVDEGLDLARYPGLRSAHPEVARLAGDPAALRAYAEANPRFYQDLGVEVYLTDPEAWRAMCGDELLELAAVRSPGFRQALRDDTAERMAAALSDLPPEPTATDLAAVEAQHGLQAAMRGDRVVLERATPDYTYRLVEEAADLALRSAIQGGRLADDLEEEPASDRLGYDAREARRDVERAVGGSVRRAPDHDVAGLLAYQRSGPEPATWWAAPGVILEQGDPEDFARVAGLLGAGRAPGLPAQAFAELYGTFLTDDAWVLDPVLAEVLRDSDLAGELLEAKAQRGVSLVPESEVTDQGVVYRFWTYRPGRDATRYEVFAAARGEVSTRVEERHPASPPSSP